MRRNSTWSGMDSLEPRQLLAFVLWDGGGGDADWNNPLNWSGDHLPGAGDNVLIDAPGRPTIHRSAAVSDTIASLWTLDPLDISAGSLTVGGEWRQSAPLFVSGGQVHNAANMIINGDTLWIAGTIDGGGNILVYPGRQFSIGGDVTLGKSIYNNGSLRWSDGNITTSGGTIQNLADRTFTISSGGTMSSSGAPAYLINYGTLVRDGAAGSTTTISVNFSNYPAFDIVQNPAAPGTVDVRAGTLSFTGDVAEKLGDSLIGNETWKVSSSTARLLLPGPDLRMVNGTVVLNGAGAAFPQVEHASSFYSLTLSGGRAFTFQGIGGGTVFSTLIIDNPGLTMTLPGMSISGLTIHGGDVTFTGGLSGSGVVVDAGASLTLGGFSMFSYAQISGAGLIRITGQLQWSGGDISGPGQLLVTASGSIITGGQYWESGFKTLTRRTVNYGSITLSTNLFTISGSFSLSAELVNRGTLNLNLYGYIDTTAGIGPGSAPGYITNFGTINSTGNLILRGAGGGVHVNNMGTVHVLSGALTLNGRTSGGGTWVTENGAELLFGGLGSVLNSPVFAGLGRVREAATAFWTGATLSGAWQFLVTPPARLTLLGASSFITGEFRNQGVVTLANAQSSAQVTGAMNNSGTLDLGTGQVHISGDFNLDPTSVLRITMKNTIQFQLGLTVGGAAHLAGAVILTFPFMPFEGVAYDYLGYASRVGSFATTTAEGLGAPLIPFFGYTPISGQVTIGTL